MVNLVKIVLAIAIFFAGIYGYYQLPVILGQDVSILLRVALVMVSLIVAVVILVTTEQGKGFLEFYKGSLIELRKMVWPTWPETRQTTMIVLIMVVLVALFLWAIDALVFNVIYDWLLGVDG